MQLAGAVARSIASKIFKSACIFRSALIIALIGSSTMMILYFVFFPSYKGQMFLDLTSYSFAVQYGNISISQYDFNLDLIMF